jgi:hypothetical protein
MFGNFAAMAFWQEWEWLLWTVLGAACAWVVLYDAYRYRPRGRGREEED